MGLFDKLMGGGRRREFGERMQGLLRSVPGIQSATFDETAFELQLVDALGAYSAPLEEVFKDVQVMPDPQFSAACTEMVQQLVRFSGGLPKDFSQAKDAILPYIRERMYYDIRTFNDLITTGIEPLLPHAELGDNLGVDLVWNSGSGIFPIEGDHLEMWGIEFDVAMAAAVQNMQKFRTKHWSTPQPRIYVSPWRSPFDACQILFHEWIGDLRVIGDPVIMIPTSDTMIVTGSSDLAGLTAMAGIVEDIIADGNRFLSLVPFTMQGKNVVPFQLPAGHHLSHRFRLMALETQMRDYTAQKENLDRWFDTNGIKMTVADFTGLENQNSRELYSYCVWPSQARPILLPKTDRIFFVDDASKGTVSRVFAWEVVMATFGEAFEELDLWPMRYKVEGYPSAEQFNACAGNE